MSRRVVITGMGCVSPVGNSVDESWDNLIHGRSGIDIIPEWQEARYNDRPLTVHIGGQVRNFDPKDWITPAKDVRRMDRFIHLAVAAGEQAWKDSGLPERLSEEDAVKMGGIIGVGLGGIITLLNEYERFVHGKARKVSAFMIPGIIGNLAPGHLAIRHNFKGPNWAPASACSSGAHGIGESYQHILDGRADMMVCGGSEAALHPLAMMGFASMNALCSTHNEDPKNASRPFDKERSGFVMGEGAGVVVIETLERAQARGATIHAEIIGYGATGDANHITAPAAEGEGAQRAMMQAINMSGLSVTDVDYINAHGTSTPMNDKYETQAIRGVFGSHVDKLLVSSTKSMTGHLLGAAGGVEAIISAKALQTGIIPPTINLNSPDPECDLNYVPHEACKADIKVALSNSFGFGGTNAVLMLRKFEEN
jgi:3-oxoacyl-[acyl-carrier-protein] synthase II